VILIFRFWLILVFRSQASGFYEWERIEGKKKGYKTPLMKEIKICYPPDRICSFICALFHIKPAIILPVTYVIAFL